MSTRHVMLAMLSIKPMTGYELSKNMDISLNSLWAATPSQIYPTLHKLQEAGLVMSKEEIRGQRMKRIVYSLTEAGIKEFEQWLLQPVRYLPFRDPFKLWASYMDSCPPEVVFKNIATHIQLNKQRAELLEDIADRIVSGDHPLIKARDERMPRERVEQIKEVRSLIYYELALQARFEVECARRILSYAKKFFAEYLLETAE